MHRVLIGSLPATILKTTGLVRENDVKYAPTVNSDIAHRTSS